jgi:hypothetical protein
MYEIIAHGYVQAETVRQFQDFFMQDNNKKVLIFNTRIFVDIPNRELLHFQAGVELAIDLHDRQHPFKGANYIPAPWLKQAIVLTKRYPAAHKQLQYAQENNLTVEVFLTNLAIAFCKDWQTVLDDRKIAIG